VRILLDTHILLWWMFDDTRLRESLRERIVSGDNQIYFSSISITEIAIKVSLDKLFAPREILLLLEEAGFSELAVTARHSEALIPLPWHHRDPFDRLLIAQAQVENLALATADAQFTAYDVQLLRA
jgi:PIN domain nuclease of toxin-antitoxin system